MLVTQIPHAAAVVEAARALRDYDSDPNNVGCPPDEMWVALRAAIMHFDSAASEDPGAVVEACAREISRAYNERTIDFKAEARSCLAAIPGVEVEK